MKSSDEMVNELREALAHHEREAARIRAMLAAAAAPPANVPVPVPVPHYYPAPLTFPTYDPPLRWWDRNTGTIPLGGAIWMVDPLGTQVTCGVMS